MLLVHDEALVSSVVSVVEHVGLLRLKIDASRASWIFGFRVIDTAGYAVFDVDETLHLREAYHAILGLTVLVVQVCELV